MGSLAGHLLPGSLFLIISMWWIVGTTRQRSQRSKLIQARRVSGSCSTSHESNAYFDDRVWYVCPGATLSRLPVEPLVKVFFALLGVIAELYDSATLFDHNGNFVQQNLDNYAHSAMYGFFGLSGAVDLVIWYNLLPLPLKFDYFVFSLAFWIEGFLFFFHLHGRDELNVRLHVILYILVFVSGFVFFIAAISDQFFHFVAFLKCYLVSLQGSWFFQVGFVLFGPNPWENSPSNVEFLGIAFAFHALFWFIVHLTFRIFSYKFCIEKKRLGEPIYEETPGEEYD